MDVQPGTYSKGDWIVHSTKPSVEMPGSGMVCAVYQIVSECNGDVGAAIRAAIFNK